MHEAILPLDGGVRPRVSDGRAPRTRNTRLPLPVVWVIRDGVFAK
ncbi:hypothetical protein FTUN_4745 [Frigoriglobus tundricola]|uniref:Uncharacterized protein n=1 Tax=Frigoriglobus tundricola TaxID=2774151 RepID=A0A6M5YUT5_9BACT|nr:hypothetical protein FTUN_4745 [Frigoriglobus tundricola]